MYRSGMFDVEAEFKKNPELKQEDLQHLRDWVAKQPHLPKVSDHYLILFLHSCYFRLEHAKSTIDNYFTIRTHAPELFADRDVNLAEITEAANTMFAAKLPGKTADGMDVFIQRLNVTDPQKYNMAAILKYSHMVADVWYSLHGTNHGHLFVFDMTGVSFGHVARLNMTIMKKNLAYLQDGLPTRLKGIHFLNVVPFIDLVMGMIKPFMNDELLSLFKFHQSGSKEIENYIPREMLPRDCGGNGKPLKELSDDLWRMVKNHSQWFEYDPLELVDETKRPGKAKTDGQVFGVDGSFKKLDFD